MVVGGAADGAKGQKTQIRALIAEVAVSVSMGFVLSVSGSLLPFLPEKLGLCALAAATLRKAEGRRFVCVLTFCGLITSVL